MTWTEGVALVTQIGVAIGVVANVIQNILNAQALRNVHSKGETVEHATNSMKDDLVSAVRKEAFQAGKIEQAAQPDSSKVSS